MNIENVSVFNIENAIRGMRNPMNSWQRGDTEGDSIGLSDMILAQKLAVASSSDRKFLRQIFVSMDITAPLYWWKEMDQYKVGTTTNSQSTMHKIATTPITIECFETDDYDPLLIIDAGIDDTGDTPYCYKYEIDDFIQSQNNSKFYYENCLISFLELLRQRYLETKDKKYWKELIRWLPESWLQKRTWTANYEVLKTIYEQRVNHKLTEWKTFCNKIKELPYANDLLII